MPQPLPKPCNETTKPFPYGEGANGFATRPPLETPPAASGQVGADLDRRDTERGTAFAALRLKLRSATAGRSASVPAEPNHLCAVYVDFGYHKKS